MTIYKQPGSPYYYYDYISKSGGIRPPPISETRPLLAALSASKRQNWPKDAQESSPRSRFLCSGILQSVFFTPSR